MTKKERIDKTKQVHLHRMHKEMEALVEMGNEKTSNGLLKIIARQSIFQTHTLQFLADLAEATAHDQETAREFVLAYAEARQEFGEMLRKEVKKAGAKKND